MHDEGLENTNFSFADLLIDSTCQMNGTQLSPSVMERSPRMYEEGMPDVIHGKDFAKSMFTYFSDNDQSFNLDPALENVVDLQEFINTAIPAVEEEESAFHLDNIFPVGDLELPDCHTHSVNTTASSAANYFDILQLVPETVQKVCMNNSKEHSCYQKDGEESQILTIKAEDLDLTPCEETQSSRSRLDTYLGDSYSSFSTQSSRSNSPSSPNTVIYECRKPGRKPSSNGPIRPRKREPPKDTPEYFEKRARNNVAVRKSREKAKSKQDETEKRVSDLQCENERLQKKVDLLSKELHVLKSLFINVGASLPENFEETLGR